MSGRELTWSELRTAFDGAVVGRLAVDTQGIVRETNRLLADILGYKKHELVGLPLDSLIPPGYREQHSAHVRSFLADPKMRRMGTGRDMWAARKDGRLISVDIGLERVIIEGKHYTLASLLDISERKQREEIEKNLASARGRLAACEELGLAAAALTIDGRVLEGNRCFGRAQVEGALSLAEAGLQRCVARTLSAIRTDAKARVIFVPSAQKRSELVIHLSPVATEGTAASGVEPQLAVAIFNRIGCASAIPGAALAHIFGLTPAEVKVAVLCRMGLRVNEIAVRLKLSKETVRSELAHIFAKAGVSSQTELASLLGRIMVSEDTCWG